MRTIFLKDAAILQATGLEKSASEKVFGEICDSLIAYVEESTQTADKILLFLLEFLKDDDRLLIAYQRLLADSLAKSLQNGFSRVGGHIYYCGQKISFVDFGRGRNFANTRLGLYLTSSESNKGNSTLALTSLRLPNTIDSWVPIALNNFSTEFNDIAEATFALRAAPQRMKE